MPLRPITWRKAVGLTIGREKAEVVSEWEESRSQLFNASVIRLIVPSPDPFKIFGRRKFTKKNMFFRDNFECQYCGVPLTIKNGTIDHVVPRSRGGDTSYLNCVASCKSCNFKKDNRTPEEAGMPLRNHLRAPNMNDFFGVREIPNEWKIFFNM